MCFNCKPWACACLVRQKRGGDCVLKCFLCGHLILMKTKMWICKLWLCDFWPNFHENWIKVMAQMPLGFQIRDGQAVICPPGWKWVNWNPKYGWTEALDEPVWMSLTVWLSCPPKTALKTESATIFLQYSGVCTKIWYRYYSWHLLIHFDTQEMSR